MIHVETDDYLQSQLTLIEKWEKDQKGLWFWEKLGRLPFAILDKLTPKFIQEKLSIALDEMGNYIQTGGQYLIKEEIVLGKFSNVMKKNYMTIDDIGDLPLEVMDNLAQQYIEARSKFAFAQGATTGIGGIFTLSMDIPLLLGLSLKTLQEVALCYGFNPKDKNERIFMIKCLQFASSDIVGKKAVLEQLASFDSNESNKAVISQLQGWREVIYSYRDNFGWKKLFQLVPIAGILFGALINKSTINDVAEAGMMLYKKRRILQKLQKIN